MTRSSSEAQAERRAFLQIGGGPWAHRELDGFRRRGYQTILSDRRRLPRGRATATFFKAIDGTNADGVLDFIRLLSDRVRIVWVNIAGEFAIPTLARLAESRLLEGIAPFDPEPFLDKRRFSSLLAGLGIPAPLEVDPARRLSVEDRVGRARLPLIVKPDVGGGHADIRLATTEIDRDRIVRDLAHAASAAGSVERGFAVQELVAGREVNIYGYVDRGCFQLMSTIEKQVRWGPHGEGVRWSRSFVAAKELDARIRSESGNIERIAAAIGYQQGFLGVTAIVTDATGEAILLEAAPLVGLDHILLADGEPLVSFVSPLQSDLRTLSDRLTTARGLLLLAGSQELSRSIREYLRSTLGRGMRVSLVPMPLKPTLRSTPRFAGNESIRAILLAEAATRDSLERLFSTIEGELHD